jgi:hypothetical protein
MEISNENKEIFGNRACNARAGHDDNSTQNVRCGGDIPHDLWNAFLRRLSASSSAAAASEEVTQTTGYPTSAGMRGNAATLNRTVRFDVQEANLASGGPMNFGSTSKMISSEGLRNGASAEPEK